MITESDNEFIEAMKKRELQAFSLRIQYEVNQTIERIKNNIDFINSCKYLKERGVLN